MGTLPRGINIARINIEIGGGGAGDKLGRVVAIEPGVVHLVYHVSKKALKHCFAYMKYLTTLAVLQAT